MSAPVSRVVLSRVSPAERLPLQRATDAAFQRLQAQEQAALNADTVLSLQRQLAELDLGQRLIFEQRFSCVSSGSGNRL